MTIERGRWRAMAAELWRRLRAIGPARRRLAADLDDELEFHLEMRAEQLQRRDGLSAEGASRASRQAFGNPVAYREEIREMWTFSRIENLWADVRFSLRALRRAPAFSLVAVVLLAVGLGASTAIFGLFDAILLRGLPYAQAEDLVVLIGNVERTDGVERRGGSFPDFADWRAEARSFEAMAIYFATTRTLEGSGEEAQRVAVEAVSAPYFDILGVVPALGRTFRDDEDSVPGRDAVAMLSHGLWQRRFGGDPRILESTIDLAGRAYSVVGVLAPGFTGVSDDAEVWIPFAMSGWNFENRGSRGFEVVARLRPGVALEGARTEMTAISKRLEMAHPEVNEKRGVEISSLVQETFGDLGRAVTALLVAVSAVLLIACANVGSLMLGRSEARRREFAVRAALGARSGRLARLTVIESLVLVLGSAVLGLGIAHFALGLLLAASPIPLPSFVDPGLDGTRLLFVFALAVVCGLLLAAGPVAHQFGQQRATTRSNAEGSSPLARALAASARGSDGARSSRLRAVLVVLEVAASVVLLVAAGLMIRSVQELVAVDPGFEAEGVLTLSVGLPPPVVLPEGGPTSSPPESTSRLLLERLRAVPGVVDAALVSDVPLGGASSAVFFSVEGDTTTGAQTAPRAYLHRVTRDFFATLGVPVLAGGFADATPANADITVVVSEGLARRFWGSADLAVGKRIKPGPPDSPRPWITVVGVVPELKYRGLPENPTADPDLYLPWRDQRSHGAVLRAAPGIAPASLESAARAAIREVEGRAVVFGVLPLAERVHALSAQSRFLGWLLGLFAATALALAAVGVYGVMNYLVTLRHREIGIRMALGAGPRTIVRMIFGQGWKLVATGLALGLVAMLGMGRVLRTLLYGVTPLDPASLGAVALLALTATFACLLPALRATKANAAQVLRGQ